MALAYRLNSMGFLKKRKKISNWALAKTPVLAKKRGRNNGICFVA